MLQTDMMVGQVEKRLSELEVPLSVTFWNGRQVMPAEPPKVSVTVRSPQVLTSLLRPTMGKLARHYVEQQIDVDGDTREILRVTESLSGSPGGSSRAASRLKKWMRHTRKFDSKAIRYHYDVSDDFFGLWLDNR